LRAESLLDLRGLQIANLEPLRGLDAIQVLLLDGNAIRDLGPLVSLAALHTVTLDAGQRGPDGSTQHGVQPDHRPISTGRPVGTARVVPAWEPCTDLDPCVLR